jgi:hypothetical protein
MEEKQHQHAIVPTTSQLTWKNRWDHWLARWGVRRMSHLVEPGLYALGQPGETSPVFVTANYSLSFDALRTALKGTNAYILVLDTQGINVWCAAGKGTFGTDELVNRIQVTGLAEIITHRRLILPQLGAPGVASHLVVQRSGFHVEYGPVRAQDLTEYLRLGKATPEMRRVGFSLRDRIVLIPVELVYVLFPWLLLAILLRSLPVVFAILAGVVVFPVLLPWLPTHNFSTKGWILGLLAALPFALKSVLSGHSPNWVDTGWALASLLTLPPITAFLALNFTGSTTFTSRSGVRREIFSYIPRMAWSFGSGIVLLIVLFFVKAGG